jgi:hypothetical protein
MVKMKSVEESVETYVSSTGLAILRYRKHLIDRRGFKPDYAMKKAVEYGLNMLQAGAGSRDDLASAESVFRELSSIYHEMAEVCLDALTNSKPMHE